MSHNRTELHTRASNVSLPNKIAGVFTGIILGLINGSLRAVFSLATIILLLPFTLIYSLFTSYSYFRKQKEYNPVLRIVLSLLSLIAAVYFNFVVISNLIYLPFANAYSGMISGFKKGFLVTLKTISNDIKNIPANILELFRN